MSGGIGNAEGSGAALVEALRARLGPAAILTGGDTASFCTDWTGTLHGHALAVARPASTAEVAETVRLCAAHEVAIVPQGGNTGLVGGATPDASGRQIILSLARMDRVRELDPIDMTLIIEAGATLLAARNAADAAGCALPLRIGSEGTAQIGGVLAANAGGNHTLRHGNARDLVLGLEVLLADGTVWDGLRRLRKDNAGYSLRHLFVGAEGTLGIITAACLSLIPRATAIEVAFASLPSAAAALALLDRLRRADADALDAFEYVSGAGLRAALRHIPGLADPLANPAAHYVLIELAAARAGADLRTPLEATLADAIRADEMTDAVVATSDAQRAAIWRLREPQGEAQDRAGPTLRHDLSVPVSRTPALIERATAACLAVLPAARPMPFGHLGDGNIHFNIVAPERMAPEEFATHSPALTEAVLAVTSDLGGSFSAEHGVGQRKTALLAAWRAPAELNLMRAIKSALDPAGRLNPGKVLPPHP